MNTVSRPLQRAGAGAALAPFSQAGFAGASSPCETADGCAARAALLRAVRLWQVSAAPVEDAADDLAAGEAAAGELGIGEVEQVADARGGAVRAGEAGDQAAETGAENAMRAGMGSAGHGEAPFLAGIGARGGAAPPVV